VAKIARDLRPVGSGWPAVTLLDFKAGFEDAARGAITSVDRVLVAVDPTTAAVRMAGDLSRMVAEIRRGTPPATRHLRSPDLVLLAERVFADARVRGVSAVLTRTRSSATEEYLPAPSRIQECGRPVSEDRAIERWLRGDLALRCSARERPDPGTAAERCRNERESSLHMTMK
jgi:hypothetical protein